MGFLILRDLLLILPNSLVLAVAQNVIYLKRTKKEIYL